MNQQSSGRRVVPRAPHEQVSSTSYRALSDDVEHTRLREARSKVAYAPTRAQTRPRATLLLWDNRVVVLEGTALVGRNPSPREGEALPVQVIAVVDRGRSVSKTHLAIGVDIPTVYYLSIAMPAAFHTLILARVYGLPGPMMRLIVVISSLIMIGAIFVGLSFF